MLVISPDGFASFPLPASGTVIIGRSDDCEIRLDDPMASRKHARLHVTPELAIEDMRSANGTRVRDQIVAGGTMVSLALGETVTIGSTLLVVRPAQDGAGVGRVWAHRWFEARIREECARAGGPRFALARLSLDQPVPWYRVVALIDRCIGAPNLFAAYGPNDYEFLLFDSDRTAAASHLDRIRTALAPLEAAVRVGIACFPADGRSADALMERANAELRPRGAAGAGRLAESDTISPAMAPVLELAHKAAGSSISVLILGETGVGKEVMAQTIHRLSTRAAGPWVALNCAGLAESLVESELFGHERGAFTGAAHAKKGLFEAANGGTLFLDEIGEMSLATQARLLRALANREILPVGSTRPRSIDVRVIAATHRDLPQEVAKGKFREDLFYRLNGFTLNIPPLRERRDEIEPLARTFLAELARASGRDPPAVSAPAVDLLLEYQWPGNIRQLKNMIERALVLCDGTVIDLKHLPVEQLRPQPASASTRDRPGATLRRSLSPQEEDERNRMLQTLEAVTWNQSRAAKVLGMARRTFVAKLDRYDIPRPRKGSVQVDAPEESDGRTD